MRSDKVFEYQVYLSKLLKDGGGCSEIGERMNSVVGARKFAKEVAEKHPGQAVHIEKWEYFGTIQWLENDRKKVTA